MITSDDYRQVVAAAAQLLVAEPSRTAPETAFGALNDLVFRARARFISKILLARHGGRVLYGPFQGMQFHPTVTEGCLAPKLLGCYEAELHPVIADGAARRGYRRVIDIGCAEGYYAAGLARLLPEATVAAYDIGPNAQAQCRRLAEMNGVAGRVQVRGACAHADLAALGDAPTLVFCDCEGSEYALLDLRAAPALARADLIVELHGTQTDPARAQAWLAQFAATHEGTIVHAGGRNPNAMPALHGWKQLDQWLAVWEFRGDPTPWAVLKAKG